MEQEWLDVAYINFGKAILHGRVVDGVDEYRCTKEREIEQVLTPEQKAAVEDLSFKHEREMRKLLRSFVEGVPA